MKSILDPSFKYVPAAATDIRKTFARVRREQQKARRESEACVVPWNPLPWNPSQVLVDFCESQRGPSRVFRYKASR